MSTSVEPQAEVVMPVTYWRRRVIAAAERVAELLAEQVIRVTGSRPQLRLEGVRLCVVRPPLAGPLAEPETER